MNVLRIVLGLLPFAGILVGVFFVNRVTPFVLGLPFLLFWMVAWAVLTAILMFVVYRLDPANRRAPPGEDSN